MPHPSQEDVHVSRPLNDFSIAYFQETDALVWPSIAPTVKAEQTTDQFGIIGKEHLQLLETEVADGARPGTFEFTISYETFVTIPHAIEVALPWRKRKNADQWLNLQSLYNRMILEVFKRSHEYRVMDACVGAGTTFGGTALAGANRWDTATGTPVDDVKTARLNIMAGCQRKPNTFVVSQLVHEELKRNAQILALIDYNPSSAGGGEPNIVRNQYLAELFEVDYYIVAEGQYLNVSLDAVGSTTPSWLWGANAFLCYVDPNVSTEMMSAMKTFVFPLWGESLQPAVRVFIEERNDRDVLKVSWDAVPEVTCTGAGYYFQTAITL